MRAGEKIVSYFGPLDSPGQWLDTPSITVTIFMPDINDTVRKKKSKALEDPPPPSSIFTLLTSELARYPRYLPLPPPLLAEGLRTR